MNSIMKKKKFQRADKKLMKFSYDEIVKTNDIKLNIKQLSLLLLKMWIKWNS